MPKFRRLVVPGYPHNVTQRGVRRQTTFFDQRDYQTYLQLAAHLLREGSVEIWAYCLMPNHVHMVVVPDESQSLASFFGQLHKQYAQRTNLRHDWSGHLWQNRFFSVVMNEQHTLTAMRYTELNPVRAGLTKMPEDWPWSSAQGNLELLDDPLIPRRTALSIVSPWAEYLSIPENVSDLNQLRRQTGSGRPGGVPAFIDEIESITGRRIKRRTAGRKKK